MPVFESIEIRRRKENDTAAEGELVCRIDSVGITLYAGSVFTQDAVAPAIFSLRESEPAAVSEAASKEGTVGSESDETHETHETHDVRSSRSARPSRTEP